MNALQMLFSDYDHDHAQALICTMFPPIYANNLHMTNKKCFFPLLIV